MGFGWNFLFLWVLVCDSFEIEVLYKDLRLWNLKPIFWVFVSEYFVK